MKQLAETDDSVGGVILRVVDSIVSVGVLTVVVGIVLFTLFPPGSFGAASSLDLGAPASVTTTSKKVYGQESPARESSRREPFNLNLEKKEAPRMPSRVNKISGIGGNRSENVIRTDDTSMRLLAPWK